MGKIPTCRVQWVARPERLSKIVTHLTTAGAELVARSGFESSTEDLDLLDDAETGQLSIAEFRIDPVEFVRQVVNCANSVGAGETMVLDLVGLRPRVQLLPVVNDAGVIVRRCNGIRRFPRRVSGFGRYNARWLADRLQQPEAV